MPFTPAHTAIVLPLIRSRFFSATGLLVGAMAPDFEYFFKMSVDGVHGHTWAGLVYFDLPVTLVLSIVFHLIVKKNLVMNLPSLVRARFGDLLVYDFKIGLRKRPMIFLWSALIGSASHILWDGFTHGTGYFVKRLGFYEDAFVPFQGVNYPLWYALQHISTFTGLTIAFLYIFLCKNNSDFSGPTVNLLYWVSLLGISSAVVLLRFLIYPYDWNLGNFVVSSISGLCVALIVCGLIPFHRSYKS